MMPNIKNVIAAVMKSNEAQAVADEGDRSGALALYEEAINLCPKEPYLGNLYSLYGTLLFEMGEFKRAQAAFTTAIEEKCMMLYEPYRRLAFALAADGQFDPASGCMLQAAELGEDDAFAAQAIATYRLALDDIDGAVFFVREDFDYSASEADPRMRVCLMRAELCWAKAEIDEATKALDLAASISPHIPSDVALWISAMDRLVGNRCDRQNVIQSLSDPEDIYGQIFRALERPDKLDTVIGNIPDWEPLIHAEIAAMAHRFAGIFSQTAGDSSRARRHYELAHQDPMAQWLIHYHMAGRSLEGLATTP